MSVLYEYPLKAERLPFCPQLARNFKLFTVLRKGAKNFSSDTVQPNEAAGKYPQRVFLGNRARSAASARRENCA